MLSAHETTDPLLYTLSHPMNEVKPALLRSPGDEGTRYAADAGMTIVWAAQEPPLLLSFCPETGRHSLWLAARASDEERLAACQKLERSICSLASLDSTPGPAAKASRASSLTPSLRGHTASASSALALSSLNTGTQTNNYSTGQTTRRSDKRGHLESLGGVWPGLGLVFVDLGLVETASLVCAERASV